MPAKPGKLRLFLVGLIATTIPMLALGFTFLILMIFVFGYFDEKLGPWGTFQLFAIIQLAFAIALGVGFPLAAIPALALKWIESRRSMVLISLAAVFVSFIFLISEITDEVGRLTGYPGAERMLPAAVLLHAATFFLLAGAWHLKVAKPNCSCDSHRNTPKGLPATRP
jgi:hypothetical protein